MRIIRKVLPFQVYTAGSPRIYDVKCMRVVHVYDPAQNR